MSDFLKTVSSLLSGAGTKINFELSGCENGEVLAKITPALGAIPEDASEEVQNAMMALSTPMLVRSKPETLEPELAEFVSQYKPVLSSGLSQLDALKKVGGKSPTTSTKGAVEPSADETPTDSKDDAVSKHDIEEL